MLRSVEPFSKTIGSHQGLFGKAVSAFFDSIERAFNVSIAINTDHFPFEDPELGDLMTTAEKLKSHGILQRLERSKVMFADEPRIFAWNAKYVTEDAAGGSSATSNRQALTAALSECLERYLWRFENDYFKKPRVSTVALMDPRISVLPERFAGFTTEQRAESRKLSIGPETKFNWIQGYSHVSRIKKYVPSQTISATYIGSEPLIRPMVTTGLATHVTDEEAILGGALEVIERDAYMIMWLNQLTLPRIDIQSLSTTHVELQALMRQLEQYKLSVQLVRLLTDAPVHVICAVITDDTSSEIPLVIGLSAHTRCADAAAHAIAECLRIRKNIRQYWLPTMKPLEVVPEKITHLERCVYWLTPERAARLSFLTKGEIEKHVDAEWENDTPKEHLARIVAWCRTTGYEFLSVNVGISKKNPTPLKVHNVVIPELQPMHLSEDHPCIGGIRLTKIPKQFGYTPRVKPFTEEPHPFT